MRETYGEDGYVDGSDEVTMTDEIHSAYASVAAGLDPLTCSPLPVWWASEHGPVKGSDGVAARWEVCAL